MKARSKTVCSVDYAGIGGNAASMNNCWKPDTRGKLFLSDYTVLSDVDVLIHLIGTFSQHFHRGVDEKRPLPGLHLSNGSHTTVPAIQPALRFVNLDGAVCC